MALRLEWSHLKWYGAMGVQNSEGNAIEVKAQKRGSLKRKGL
jgi:hypothetical protein